MFNPNWHPLSETPIHKKVADWLRRTLPDVSVRKMVCAQLSFYPTGGWLVRVTLGDNERKAEAEEDGMEKILYLLLHKTGGIYPLDFTNEPIYTFNSQEGITITEDTAPDYVAFFFDFVEGRHGRFHIIRSFEEVPLDDITDEANEGEESEPFHEFRQALSDEIVSNPVFFKGEGNAFSFKQSMLFQQSLFHATVHVENNGEVSLRDEELIYEDIPYTMPEDPKTLKDEELHDLLGQQSLADSARGIERVSRSKTAPGGKNDMHVMEVVNRVLLTEALAQMEGHILFSSELRSDIEDHTLFDRFSEMLANTKPVVIIETVFPFFEDVIATMITSQSGYPLNLVKPNIHSNVDGKLNQVRSLNDKQLLTLPIHSYRLGVNDELLSHEIALSDSAILIGCHSINDVPEPLRRITDMTLHIPSIHKFNFGTIFNELYGHLPPENQVKDIYRWVNQVLPTDFQQPLRLELPLNRTIPYIRQRVEKRMSSVQSEEGPGIDDLYGLGEAKHVARDLIADVEAATRGELSWDRVDKGMLMVGPPGTGKTTLARAIAKESGLKFINASASEWQMVDHLGHHLTNIRRDFALARRYAPSILFIDELDSIGNRQQFSGKNAAYSTQVVNTLLSEIQGFEEDGKVIVIGASNYLNNIDPALRRAGRLDQIVQVSYPNIKALTNIYSFYLTPMLEDDSDLEEQISFKELAQLSFGCTGADIEEYVRGALRRARKERRKLQKSDLIDEITGKSRSGAGTMRMNRDDMHRVAVHEGGHALMKILSSTQGLDISMVSIVPRSDGSLGFVASIPDERAMRTRKEYHELLEVFLGGRAAEEVIFGKEHISSGAGGSKQSDLAKATTLAQRMITRYGLGEDTSLLWSEKPAPKDLDKVRQMLEKTYVTVLDKLRNEKEKLEQIAELLVEEQEIEGRVLLERVSKVGMR